MVKSIVLSVGLIASGCAAQQQAGVSPAKAQSQRDDTIMIAIIGGLIAAIAIGAAIACGDKTNC